MTPREFCTWLEGALDASQPDGGSVTLTEAQVTKIRENLTAALAHKEPKKPKRPPRQPPSNPNRLIRC